MAYLTEFGFIGLFIAAFLAATILPLSSEFVLSSLIVNGLSPSLLITTATIGNVLGSCVNYAIGYWMRQEKIPTWFTLSEQDLKHAEKRFSQYGLLSLLFAWLPVIGDPLTIVAGMLRVRFIWFIILVTIGKLLRYLFMTYVTLQAL